MNLVTKMRGSEADTSESDLNDSAQRRLTSALELAPVKSAVVVTIAPSQTEQAFG